MAVYQFPDNELQNIESLVWQIAGGDLGLNQLHNPDESNSLAGEQANAILSNLLELRNRITQDDHAGVAAAISTHQDIVFQMKRIPADSNPLLYDILKKSNRVVLDVKNNPTYKLALRKYEVHERIRHYDRLLYPAQATQEIQELFNDTINRLQNENINRNSPIRNPTDKKSFLSRFFSTKSNKVMDASQIQRIPQAELDEVVFFLKGIGSMMPQASDASTTLGLTLNITINTLHKALDSLPPSSSPLISNALSLLTSKLQDYLMYVNNAGNNFSSAAANIYEAFLNANFENFLKSSAGRHFLIVGINPDLNSHFERELTHEERESFRSATDENFNNRENALLSFLTEEKYTDFKYEIDNQFEPLMVEQEESINSIKPSGPGSSY